jgi:polyhydroxyalkanoate synthesis regulator phasin
MNAQIKDITDYVKETAETVKGHAEEARTRVTKIEQDSRDAIRKLLERGRTSSGKSRERLDEWLETLRSREVIDRLSSADVKKQVQGFRKEILDLFGLATREEVQGLEKRLAKLDRQIAKLAKKAAAKMATAKKAAARKAAPKSGKPKKAAPKKRATKA